MTKAVPHAKNLPQHIAIIPDGNRRWAKQHHVPTLRGHKKGVDVFERICNAAFDRGITYVTFYGFSNENWNRSKSEVSYLMRLLKWVFAHKMDMFAKRGVQFRAIGRLDEFSADIRTTVKKAMEVTAAGTKGVVTIALNYTGRNEIVDMVKKALREKLNPATLTEQRVGKLAYATDIPDPDLIIRTSGEERLSGFLLWESAYSELYFCKKYFPDFTEKELDKALAAYALRQRRFGK